MEDAERFRLLGTYQTPRFRIGQRVLCQIRGEMVITGVSDAPIPWPVGSHGRGRVSLIVYKDLAKAIRRESNQAVCHWWGVTVPTVTKWRKLLGVVIAETGVVWTAEEDELAWTLPAAEVVKRTGRSLGAVYTRRSRLKVQQSRQE